MLPIAAFRGKPRITVALSNYTPTASSAVAAIVSPSVTSTVTGGSGSYTYAWSFTANSGGLTITTPAASATTFQKSGAVSGNDYVATAILTVTDTVLGVSGVSPSCNITLTRT